MRLDAIACSEDRTLNGQMNKIAQAIPFAGRAFARPVGYRKFRAQGFDGLHGPGKAVALPSSAASRRS